jgi:hypothetical protein
MHLIPDGPILGPLVGCRRFSFLPLLGFGGGGEFAALLCGVE